MHKRLFLYSAVACLFLALVSVVAGQVSITHLSPTSGVAGALVRIHGVGFSSAATVEFGGTPATTVHYFNANLIIAEVPTGASVGNSAVQIKVGANTSHLSPFSVLKAGAQGFADQTVLRLPLYTRNSRTILAADIDGDFDADLTDITEYRDIPLINDGAGHYVVEPERLPGPFLASGDGDFCDVDGDGDFDLIVVNRENQDNQLYLNDGSGFFAEVFGALPTLSDFSRDAACGDLDNDGDVDIVVASNEPETSILVNDGAGIFADETAARGLGGLVTVYAVDLGDVDNDGDLDILFGSPTLVWLFINDGSGSFVDETTTRIPWALGTPIEITFADVDNDTDLDIFVPNSGGVENQLFINDGSGHFTDESSARLPVDGDNDFCAEFGDIDGDGDLDLITGVDLAPNRVLRNDGSGFFSYADPGTLSDIALRTFGLALTDANADGWLDLVTAEYGDINHLYVASDEIHAGPILQKLCPQLLAKPFDMIKFKLQAEHPEGDKLTFHVVNPPAGASFNEKNGQFQWKPDLADVGRYNIIFYVQDTHGATDWLQMQILVETGTHDFNNVELLISEDGRHGASARSGAGNFGFFPNGTCDFYIYTSGFWVGGIVDGTPIVAEAAHRSEFVPSEIGETGEPFRVFNSSMGKDKQNWPPEFSDPNGKPVIFGGAQNLVVEYNDLYGAPIRDVPLPLGIEVKQRSLAYNGAGKRDAIIFIWEISNISDHNIEQGYFGFWTDTDIGDATEDRASIVNDMGIVWDHDFYEPDFSELPAVMGFDFLETPGDLGVVNFYGWGIPGTPSDPNTDGWEYDVLSGNSQNETGLAADVRFVLSTGPFDLTSGQSVLLAGALLFGRAPEGTTELSVDPVTYRPDPNDPVLAELLSTQETIRSFYEKHLRKQVLSKSGLLADEIPDEAIPSEYSLSQNHPNPFNPETEIRFALPEANHVTLRIFNTLGQEVRTLVDTPYQAGYHSMTWDSKDNHGNLVSSGVYLYQIKAGDFVQVRKMSLLR